MDNTTYLFDLLKTILPAIIVAGAIFLLFRQYLEKDQHRRLIDPTPAPASLRAHDALPGAHFA
jgi:hypothetical protein